MTWENIPGRRRTLQWHTNPQQYASWSKRKLPLITYCNENFEEKPGEIFSSIMGALCCRRRGQEVERGALARETHSTAAAVVGNTLQMSVKIHTFFYPESNVYSTFRGCTLYILRSLSVLVICSVARGQDLVALPFNVTCCIALLTYQQLTICCLHFLSRFALRVIYSTLFGRCALQWTCCFHESMTQLFFWQTFGQTSKQKLLFHITPHFRSLVLKRVSQ